MPRQKFTCEQKNLARDLKNEGKKPCEIIKIFKDRYGVVVKASTMSTWYNDKNMETHEQRVSTNTSMAHVETHVNPRQRATILLDTEYALLGMIKKGNIIGTTSLRKSVQNMGKGIFDKLRASNIYDGPGRRRRSLSVLNVVQMNKLLEYISEDRILCPICETPVTSVSDDSLNVHLQSHPNPDNEQMTSPPGGKTFLFGASDGWVRNFLRRNEPVFNQLETHKKELDDLYKDYKIKECSVRLKRLETSNIINKPSNVDQHKNHDFELDKQSDVELNEKSDGELDIDCIRNYLNTLPCTPGGNCSCDTDFTSQIPEYIIDLFNMMPDNNIIIVDNDKIIYL